MISILGILTALAGFIYSAVVIFNRVTGDVVVKGWASNIVIILFLSGIQMIMIGIIGEYLWRTLDQVKNRPLYTIEKEYD